MSTEVVGTMDTCACPCAAEGTVTSSASSALRDVLAPIVARWRGEEGNLIMILHALQHAVGYVPRAAALELSRMLDVPLARIYEVITFYNYFKLEPPGKYVIAVCTGTACYLKGAPMIIDTLREVLDLGEGRRVTADGLFQVEEVRCLGCCGLAPVLTVNGEVFGRVKQSDVPDIVEQFREREAGVQRG
ncbi:MAG: NAD(P)H-dependent oxidoreductase subunit E [bacterium]|nr:NAD(P)H-dependent oxidoreductase subunit E [bacterium]